MISNFQWLHMMQALTRTITLIRILRLIYLWPHHNTEMPACAHWIITQQHTSSDLFLFLNFFSPPCSSRESRESSGGIVTRLRTGRLGFHSREQQGIIFFSAVPRMALGSIPPSIRWAPKGLFTGVNDRGVKRTTHIRLVLRLRPVELHLHSPIYLHGLVLNYITK
jgi:hypothetical protein